LKADNNTEHSSPSTSLRGDRGAERRYNIKNILLTTLWVAIGACTVVLFVAAIRIKELKHCRGIEINISGASNNFFIDKTDVQRIIVEYAGKNAIGRPIENFNLVGMETALKKDVWIKDAELFFDNNEILQVTVEEREPVARIFTPGGNTFYIDSSNMMLPLSEKFSARLPVFTGFPSEAKILSKADSNLLNDIKNISIRIQQDSFLMAMIDQVDITAQRNFEMIPKLGNQVIVFGDASDTENKFKKLQLFYKKVMMQAGWNRYSIINLQYKNQVVAKIKGKDDASADSLRTKQMMEIIAANAARHAEDSTNTIIQDDRKNNDSSMIQQSMQRDESGEISNTDEEPKPQGKLFEPVEKPVTKIPVNTNQKPPAKPGILKKTGNEKPKPGNEKPKIIMPRKNDY
jgi:cell division protein FtsQ